MRVEGGSSASRVRVETRTRDVGCDLYSSYVAGFLYLCEFYTSRYGYNMIAYVFLLVAVNWKLKETSINYRRC